MFPDKHRDKVHWTKCPLLLDRTRWHTAQGLRWREHSAPKDSQKRANYPSLHFNPRAHHVIGTKYFPVWWHLFYCICSKAALAPALSVCCCFLSKQRLYCSLFKAALALPLKVSCCFLSKQHLYCSLSEAASDCCSHLPWTALFWILPRVNLYILHQTPYYTEIVLFIMSPFFTRKSEQEA